MSTLFLFYIGYKSPLSSPGLWPITTAPTGLYWTLKITSYILAWDVTGNFKKCSETLSDNYVTYHIVSKPVETSLRESENTCFLVVEAKMLLLSFLDFNKPQECCVYLPWTSSQSSYMNMYRRRGATKFYTLTDYLCPEVQIFITVYTINLFWRETKALQMPSIENGTPFIYWTFSRQSESLFYTTGLSNLLNTPNW